MQGKKSPSRMVIMEFLSYHYGWLPSEIEKEDWDNIVMYYELLKIRTKIQNGK